MAIPWWIFALMDILQITIFIKILKNKGQKGKMAQLYSFLSSICLMLSVNNAFLQVVFEPRLTKSWSSQLINNLTKLKAQTRVSLYIYISFHHVQIMSCFIHICIVDTLFWIIFYLDLFIPLFCMQVNTILWIPSQWRAPFGRAVRRYKAL